MDSKRNSIINTMPVKMDIIAQFLSISDRKDVLDYLAQLPDIEHGALSIQVLSAGDDRIESNEENLIHKGDSDDNNLFNQIVRSRDGTVYKIAFVASIDNEKEWSFFFAPFYLFNIGMGVGLFSSIFLAWNLTRPIRLLKKAFFQVSQGNLSIQLYPTLSSRHDEISDLAKHFDIMVEKLQLLMDLKQTLLHDVSHELRSPLARLKLAIGLALQNKKNTRYALDRISLESERLEALINEILSYAKQDIEPSLYDHYFDLHELLTLAVHDANFESNSYSITIKYKANNIIHPIINGNAEQIRRAIDNILRNAIRFSKSGQHIDVSLHEIKDYLQIKIKDIGPGVKQEDINHIFEPFYRTPSTEKVTGYGLGLAIAKKTITSHKGVIYAKNGELGGLIITIELPLLPHYSAIKNNQG